MKKQTKYFMTRALALFLSLTMCFGTLQVTALAAEADENEGTNVGENQFGVDVTVTTDENNNIDVNVNVTGRPVGDRDATDQVEETYSATDVDEESGVKAEVNGTVTSTPGTTAETDEEGRPISEKGGEIKGEEKTTIELPTETSEPETETVESGLICESNENSFTFDKDGNVTASPDNGGKTSADIDALIDALKPTAPDSTTKGDFGEDGFGTQTKTDWSVEDLEEGKKGWTTVEKVTTTEKGQLSADSLNWAAPDGATKNEDGTYSKTETSEPDENGVITTVTTTYNPASGTYEKVTTKITTTVVTFEETAEGTITVTGVSVGVGLENGGHNKITSLGPTSAVMKIGPTNQSQLKYKNGKWTSTGGAGWLADHLMEPFSEKKATTDELTYTENALRSSLFINLANKDKPLEGQASIRKLTAKDGSVVYVYCAQHDLLDKKEVGYDIINADDATYLTEEQALHIQYIAEKGYWGTKSGNTGSLQKVSELIGDQGQYITDGIALAVTQAAIWYYSDGAEMFEKDGKLIDIFTQCFTRATTGGGYSQNGDLDAVEQKAAMALFEALIQKGNDDLKVKQTTDIISQEDIKATSISVNEKVQAVTEDDIDELVKQMEAFEGGGKQKAEALAESGERTLRNLYEDNKDKLYKTDLSLTVAVVKDRMNSDDMTVYVYADGVKVTSYTLTDEDKDNNGELTIKLPNVVLPAGVEITLNLSGTQELAKGAYLFRSDVDYSKSQTMVGYVKGGSERTVDLNVNMEFNVTDPTVSESTEVTVTQTITENRKWSESWEKDYEYTSESTEETTWEVPSEAPSYELPTIEVPSEPEEDPSEPSTEPSTDPTEPTTPTEPTEPTEPTTPTEPTDPTDPTEPTESTEPSTDPEEEIPDEDPPMTNMEEEEPEEEDVPDEDVPLVDVPKTNDLAAFWYAATALSALGLTILRKKEEE